MFQLSKDDPSLQQKDILDFSEDSAYVFNDDISHERQEANVVSVYNLLHFVTRNQELSYRYQKNLFWHLRFMNLRVHM